MSAEPVYLLNIDVADAKYTVIQHRDGRVEAMRYGELWRDLTGDNLVLAMAQEIQELRNWRDQAFRAHPNIDLDIEHLT